MFLHFPNVIKPAAVTEFTAVTAPMCHESVTEPLSRVMSQESVTVWPPSHTIWHTSHSLLGISHNISSPQILLHSLLITQPLQVWVLTCSLSDSESRFSRLSIWKNFKNRLYSILSKTTDVWYSVFDQVFLFVTTLRSSFSVWWRCYLRLVSMWQLTTRL